MSRVLTSKGLRVCLGTCSPGLNPAAGAVSAAANRGTCRPPTRGLLCLGRLFHVKGTVRSFVSEEKRGEHTNTNFNSSRHGLETCLNGHRAISLTVCLHSPRQTKSVIFITFQSRKLWFAELKTQRSHAPGFHLQGVSRIGKPRDTE